MAAKFEFEELVAAARALLQQGLRVNSYTPAVAANMCFCCSKTLIMLIQTLARLT